MDNNKSFLQSLKWEEFQKSFNRKIWRIEEILVIKHNLPLGKSYLYCPRVSREISNDFIEQVKEIALQEESIFFKVEPDFTNYKLQITNYKFIKSSKQIQPAKTIILDIDQPEQELLSQMHSKVRYNIRLAQKKGVEIKESDNIDSFFKLLKETAKRDKFHLHPEEYYRKMLKGGITKLFVAEYQNQVVAANLVCFFGQTAIYLHGASDHKYRQLMAPYLLQWQIILGAKKLGLKYYDFGGIDEIKWPGVTRFKRGFNGREVSYPGSFDLIFQKTWYLVYKLARKIL